MVGHDSHIDINDIVDDTITCNGFLEAVEGFIILETEEVVMRGQSGGVEPDINTRGLVLRICVDRTEGNGTEVNFSTVWSVSLGVMKSVEGGALAIVFL